MDDAEWQSYSEAEQAQLTELELWIKVTPALTPNPEPAEARGAVPYTPTLTLDP